MSALVICRFIHFAALAMVFGAAFLRPLLLGAAGDRLRNSLNPLLCLLAGLGLVSGAAWVALLSADIHGNWQAALDLAQIKGLLTGTFFGKVWSLHLIACAVLLFSLRIPSPKMMMVSRPISAVALASLAPIGHGAMFEGVTGQLMVVNQLLHLLLIGAWMGGLLLLLFVLNLPKLFDGLTVLRQFSQIGVWLVGGILLTGLINVRMMTGSFWPLPGSSGFANVLALKTVLVLGMLGLAWHNRRQLAQADLPLPRLRRAVLAEWALGLAALASVALLGTLAPVPLS